MTRTLVSAAVLALLAGGAGVATAGPGPNGKNDFGLCKAYFAGSEQGKENKRDKGPFPGLETKAGDFDGDGDMDEDDVSAYCGTVFPGGKGAAPGGSGSGSGADKNGRP